MESNRQLIQSVLQYSFSFKPAKKPQKSISSTYQQINHDQIMNQTFSTWYQLTKTYCPQILEYYPVEKHKNEYDQEVCLIDAELKFKAKNSAPLRYTLIKSKKQIERFKIEHNKRMKKQHKDGSVSQNIFDILSNYSLNDIKEKFAFEEFIEQIAPHDRWDIRILGQYKVSEIEGTLKSCIEQTVFRPCQRFNKYYLTIANECVIYSDESLSEGSVDEAIPYTYAFKVECVKALTNRFGARITSGSTQITVAFHDLFDIIKFAYTINLVQKSLSHYFKIDQEVKSFSPIRQNNWTRFYNDGQSYFSDLYDQIQKAQKKICITGWCITPYFLLKRPQSIQDGESRLDKTLGRAAKRGVKIFIIVFQEPSLLLNNDSYNVWETFENMSENFKILRHPGIVVPQLWSHHEKSVIIDEKVAFMGGLDICYGRWDTHDHPINDKGGLWEGADYVNERQRGITEPRRFQRSNLDRQLEPRMPWHDIAMQLKGPAVVDLQRHFCQYWYFAIHDLTDDFRDQVKNFRTRIDELERQERQQQERNEELFNQKRLTDFQMRQMQIRYAHQKHNDKTGEDYTFSDRLRHAKQAFKDLVQNKEAITSKELVVQGFAINQKAGNMRLRLCRSSSTWSTGIENTEHSIYDAYMKLIREAKEFIYIENQFFMSYENLISQEIAERILKAYESKKKFKVIVMMPLLPGFEGDPRDPKSAALRVQMQLQFQAISRHKDSIFQIINRKNPNIQIEDYIYFFGLRNHSLFGPNKDIPKTQIIYVHSKLMIVDDRHMIIGSANINDRSLMGNRDSELAMVIEDPKGKYGEGSIFEFRCRIFNEHFGMSERNCQNIESYWSDLIDYAKNNAKIYREVFGCYPDNTAVKFEHIAELEKKANPKLYFENIDDLYGHYVEWPIDFLKEQDLSLKLGQKQYFFPITLFT